MRATSVGPDVSKAIVQIVETISGASRDANPEATADDSTADGPTGDEPDSPASAELPPITKPEELIPPPPVAGPAKTDEAVKPTAKGGKALPLSA
ncbi:MAG: hypothetical protein JO280_06855 [Mycobacteriaceae bacterium]|nr:hypothetical protein [Mycobacteriaceae bacterium]